ncbi:MAG: zinc-dependent peptidase [Prosthecobacter sp.]|uniref:M90 family metallopeptidase n=1 Tax=Prosthecobacter sp. TaxID=1965333 RepID=UPI00260481C1|nr:M90 family metallopeptidase [Prosthecobacter sp.]MCF7789563.1 zinc-dependent peptidase [Prosthecobacter sp.]
MIWEKLKELLGIEAKEPAVFHEEWIALLKKNIPLYARLPEDLRQRLHERIAQFISTIRFEGCGGLELTEDMILTVAAQACLLVVHREGRPYPKLSAVYIYPTTFSSVSWRRDAHGIVTEGAVHRLGESSAWGTVVLAWDSVTQGARYIHDGDNVTFHEFAHQLDHEDGPTDGAPALRSGAAYRTWSHVFHDNYADFLQRTEEGRKTVLDAYGATNPAEFFAVATETFFEKPQKLYEKRPEMYAELARYYHLDPREWME